MTLYAQHGYGKSDKIQQAIRHNYLSGAILSPRDELPGTIGDLIQEVRGVANSDFVILFDPQYYALTLAQAKDRYLPKYEYYRSGLTRSDFGSLRRIREFVETTLNYERSLDVDMLVSPSVLFSRFDDPWSQIALTMGQESIDFLEEVNEHKPLLVSLVFDENALDDTQSLGDFLDMVSVWRAEGFYVLMRLNDLSYPPKIEERRLGKLMYLVYVLATVNGFRVICGYSDLVGVLLHAVGAGAACSGWSQNLRRFSLQRFEPDVRGRTPRPRYTSLPLLNSILVGEELVNVYRVGLLGEVLSSTQQDVVFSRGNPGDASWSNRESCLHHWAVLSRLFDEVTASDSVSERLGIVENWIHQALAHYSVLENAGVMFGTYSGGTNLRVWLKAIEEFRADAGMR